MSGFPSFGGAEKKTGTLFGSTVAPPGGLFQQSQQQNPPQAAPSLFGQSANPQPTGLFNNVQATQGSLFQSQNGQQQQQQQPLNNSLFGGQLLPAPTLNAVQAQSLQQSKQGLPQLRTSAESPFATTLLTGQREKSVVEQMDVITKKWRPTENSCVFRAYLYNQVKPEEAPYYGPQPHEDERKWEEALAKKPSPGSIPVLVSGFEEMAARIKYQNLAVNALQQRLHQINESLTVLKNSHELDIASRIAEAKRKHIVFAQRTLALATKVQILRNRGYVMDTAEEELKKKLLELEKRTFDPVLGGRQEEIWARMSGVRERARILQDETEKLSKTVEGQQNGEVLSDDDQKQIEKLLKDYDKQLEHLKKWVDDTRQEYDEWEKEKPGKVSDGR